MRMMESDVKEERQSKQVIIIRKDLNMRLGKCVAQGSHASLGAILQLMETTNYDDVQERSLYLFDGAPTTEWLKNSFTKICVRVESEEELVSIYDQAKLAGLNAVMIEDNGLTEFHGEKTKTCVCIGPNFSDEIDKITKHLKLL